jgi:hypothetical protein
MKEMIRSSSMRSTFYNVDKEKWLLFKEANETFNLPFEIMITIFNTIVHYYSLHSYNINAIIKGMFMKVYITPSIQSPSFELITTPTALFTINFVYILNQSLKWFFSFKRQDRSSGLRGIDRITIISYTHYANRVMHDAFYEWACCDEWREYIHLRKKSTRGDEYEYSIKVNHGDYIMSFKSLCNGKRPLRGFGPSSTLIFNKMPLDFFINDDGMPFLCTLINGGPNTILHVDCEEEVGKKQLQSFFPVDHNDNENFIQMYNVILI